MQGPILAMEGNLRLLGQAVEPAGRGKDYFQAIAASCGDLKSAIDDCLGAARLATGNFQLQPAPCDPAALMRRAVQALDSVSRDKESVIDISLPADAPASLVADEWLLERVIAHLLSNAVKFSPQGARVAAAMALAGGDQLEFSVSDKGPGLAPDQKARLFDRLGRPPAASGTADGFGLPECFKIVQLHHGSLWVESAPGQGSQFVFRIPLRQPARD
jgi:signal transduction histidine kinase